jgi:hypothetical protein
MMLVDVLPLQELLTALDKSTELLQSLTAFMKPVRAVIVEFTQLRDTRMQEPIATVQIHRRVINRLTHCMTAKDTRACFANIKLQLENAMVVLNQAVNAIDLGVDVETRQIVGEIKQDVR